MAAYDDWNSAIADAFTKGVPLGAPVYLAIDDEELASVGAAAFGDDMTGHDGWTDDFCLALRAKVAGGRAVDLSTIESEHAEPPACVAFLAAMVLAASRMAEGAEFSELNYFTHLRDILGWGGAGRAKQPPVDCPAAKRSLLQEWNDRLRRRGLAHRRPRPEGAHNTSATRIRGATSEADRNTSRGVRRRAVASVHCDPQTLAAILEAQRWPTATFVTMGREGRVAQRRRMRFSERSRCEGESLSTESLANGGCPPVDGRTLPGRGPYHGSRLLSAASADAARSRHGCSANNRAGR